MSRRKMILLLALATAVGGPYFSSTEGLSSLKRRWNQLVQSSGINDITLSMFGRSAEKGEEGKEQKSTVPGAIGSGVKQNGAARDTHYDLPVVQPNEFRQLFDFNITPNWVISKWPRVSTSLAEMNMKGMRVALLTGTRTDDLFGSLTYYFDNRQRLQRVSFSGQTADPTKLIKLLIDQHGFRAEHTLDAGLYLKWWNGKPTSALWIGHAPLLQNSSPNSRLKIRLEINRTDGRYQLSDELAQFLGTRRRAGRW